ncbi:band 4.1-like protein 4B isoform X1, partial [Arapaima gigas]
MKSGQEYVTANPSIQTEEKQLSEKSLHSPVISPSLPDRLKCNILKAQMDTAFRVMTEGDCRRSSTGQEYNS